MDLTRKYLDSPECRRNGWRGKEVGGGMRDGRTEQTLKALIHVHIESKDKIFNEAALKHLQQILFIFGIL